jgi:hypothetical protein
MPTSAPLPQTCYAKRTFWSPVLSRCPWPLAPEPGLAQQLRLYSVPSPEERWLLRGSQSGSLSAAWPLCRGTHPCACALSPLRSVSTSAPLAIRERLSVHVLSRRRDLVFLSASCMNPEKKGPQLAPIATSCSLSDPELATHVGPRSLRSTQKITRGCGLSLILLLHCHKLLSF